VLFNGYVYVAGRRGSRLGLGLALALAGHGRSRETGTA
jgi:hypothetical protein